MTKRQIRKIHRELDRYSPDRYYYIGPETPPDEAERIRASVPEGAIKFILPAPPGGVE